jgi:uncharacterized membrane protein (UPF0127 family)
MSSVQIRLDPFGRLAQLVERSPCTREVRRFDPGGVHFSFGVFCMEYDFGLVKKVSGVVGLMFKFNPPKLPYFIPLPVGDKSIHTWFMFFDIDVFFVNKDGVVVDGTAMKPWQHYNPIGEGIVGAIETKHDLFKDVKVGDKIRYMFG